MRRAIENDAKLWLGNEDGWRISDLRRAGALIAAEIDRLLVLQQKPTDETVNQKRAEMGLPPIEFEDES